MENDIPREEEEVNIDEAVAIVESLIEDSRLTEPEQDALEEVRAFVQLKRLRELTSE